MPQLAGAGEGAASALEQIVKQRFLEQELAARIAEREERARIEREQLAQRKLEMDTDRDLEQQRIDAVNTNRRDQNNTRGVRRMLGDALTQGTGDLGPEDRRGLAALQVEAGDAPTLLNAPPVKRHQVTVRGPDGKPITKLVTEDELAQGVEEYREPPKADRPQVFNVGNGKLVDASGRVIYDGGPSGGAGGPSAYASERNARTSSAVDSIIGDVSGWTAGYGGLLANLPQTEARKLRGKLDTLRANIAFNELAAMREASKTGGALGSVAVRELELLQNSLGNLDQLQDPQALVAELTKIKEAAQRWEQAAGGAAQAAPMQPTSSPSSHGTAPRRLRFDRTGKPIP